MILIKKIYNKICKHFIKYCLNISYEIIRNNELSFINHLFFCGTNVVFGKRPVVSSPQYISIGNNVSIGNDCRINAIDKYFDDNYSPKIVISDNVSIQDYFHIGCIDSVYIGNNTLIASKVFITDHMHGNISSCENFTPPIKRRLSHKPVRIGDNVWIGESVSILSGVELGDNVIVGANSVVTHSFPSNTVIAGVPAKVLKSL